MLTSGFDVPPGATVFDVPANTASLGETIAYCFESDIDYTVTVNGVIDTDIHRDITRATSTPYPNLRPGP